MFSSIYAGYLSSSPIGGLWAAVSDTGVVMIEWDMPEGDFFRLVYRRFHKAATYDEHRTAETLRQVDEYLGGKLHQFSLPLDLSTMTSFQQRVLQLTSQVPYGHTTTYQTIARQAGTPRAARAVGRVEATNPIPLIIPCHRVLGTDGSLHGYGGPGGIKLKAWLLNLEQSAI